MMLANILTPAPDFDDVIRRLMAGDPRNPRPVAWTMALNLPTDNVRLVVKFMCATAELSIRCLRPAYAFTIAWHADENPTDDAMKAVAVATLARAGLGENQALLICPADRMHPCVRVVVNRIHPEIGRAWATSYDFRRFEAIMKELAAEHGFRHVPSRRANTVAV